MTRGSYSGFKYIEVQYRMGGSTPYLWRRSEKYLSFYLLGG